MTKEEAEELIKKPKRLLSAIDQQRQYIAELGLQPSPCPSCGFKSSLFDACINPYGYEPSGGNHTFACPSCKRPLKKIIPLLGTRSWYWIIDFDAEE